MIDAFVTIIPGRCGQWLRHVYYSCRLRALGASSSIGMGVTFSSLERISIGSAFTVLSHSCLAADDGGTIEIADEVSLSTNVTIDAGARGVIRIGSGSGIGPNSVLRSSAHRTSDPDIPWKRQGHKPGSIIMEEDVWVAANCTLLPGTHLEKGVVVASGSVVGGYVKALSVVAGNPARVIGRRGA